MNNIIFDLDGTLIDSSECIFGIYKILFSELGIGLPSEKIMRAFIGPPVEGVIKKYLPENKCASACSRFRELYNEVDLKKANRLFDGVEEMLKQLSKSGKRLFIASTKNEKVANLVIELLGIDKFFTKIYGSRFEIGRLTKEKVLLDLIDEWKISINDCCLVGDTHYDAEGANKVGMDVVIVNYGFADEERLRDYKIKARLNTPKEVSTYFLGV